MEYQNKISQSRAKLICSGIFPNVGRPWCSGRVDSGDVTIMSRLEHHVGRQEEAVSPQLSVTVAPERFA